MKPTAMERVKRGEEGVKKRSQWRPCWLKTNDVVTGAESAIVSGSDFPAVDDVDLAK